MKIKTAILSKLLNLANRTTKRAEFYVIKDRILSKRGTPIGYDLQYLEGKKCHSCDNGVYIGYRYSHNEFEHEWCFRCNGTGWYKPKTWVLLQRIQFGNYTFHKPVKRYYGKRPQFDGSRPEFTIDLPLSDEIIDGYILKLRTPKYGPDAVAVLFILYDFKRWWAEWKKGLGFGWRCAWWLPRNWLHNAAHIIKKGKDSYPMQKIRKLNNTCSVIHRYDTDEDLPF